MFPTMRILAQSRLRPPRNAGTGLGGRSADAERDPPRLRMTFIPFIPFGSRGARGRPVPDPGTCRLRKLCAEMETAPHPIVPPHRGP